METFPWWTEAQKKLAQEAKKVVDELMPLALEYGWKRKYPWPVAKEIAKRGYYGAIISQKYGGHLEDWGITGACIIGEEVSRLGAYAADFSNTMSNGGTHQLGHAGNEEQRQKWLPRVARGELHGCITMTEPYVGSDSAAMETTGVRDGDFYVVNGKKRFITNAAAGDLYMTYVRTDDSPEARAKYRHLTGLIIEKGTPGFTVERVNELIGLDGMYNAFLNFDNVRVPVASRLGQEGDGWTIMTGGLNPERAIIASTVLGRMREALKYAVFHMQRRVQFGQPTINQQGNQFKLADMVVKLKTARLLTYYTAYLCDLGQDTPVDSAILKLYNTETLTRSFIMDAIQCMGGDGVTKFYPVERIMRDAKVLEIAGGTSEIMRLLIYRLGIRAWEDDLVAPRRVMNKELNVPLPAREGELPKYEATEDGVVAALAENYRVNPGLYMTLQELKEQIPASDEEIAKLAAGLEAKGLAKTHKGRRGNVELIRPTYEALSKAHPQDYYKYIPYWASAEDMF